MRKSDFKWKPFLKAIAGIAIPVALQNLLATTGSMVDTIMIAALGELQVGAIGLCAQFSSLLFSSYWGFVGGGMLFFAQYYGAKDDDGVNRAYGVTVAFILTVGLIFWAAATFFPESVMAVYTDKPSIIKIGAEYLRITGLSYPLMSFSAALCALLRTTERPKLPLYASIASVITNIVLNYLLINGVWIFPRLEIKGAAIATLTSNFVNVSIMVIAALITKHRFIFAFKKHFCWTKSFLKEYFVKCMPILANEFLLGVGNLVINMVLGRQAEEAIAAVAVFRTFEGLVITFFAGFSNASAVLTGNSVGAGYLEEAYERAKRIVALCTGFIVLLGICIVILSSPILKIMNLSDASIGIGKGILLIYCCIAWIRMSNWTMNDTFRSGGDAAFGAIREIIFMYLMVIPLVLLSGLKLRLNFYITFALCYSDEVIRFIMMLTHLLSGKWIKPVTPQGKEALNAFFEKRNKKRTA